MNANRVGPTPPESGKGPNQEIRSQSQGRKGFEKIEKIKEVGEVDPDESRARKFRQALDDAENQLSNAIKKSPSPFETAFYATGEGGLEDPGVVPNPPLGSSNQEPIPGPGYSPPPTLSPPPPPAPEEGDGEAPLPRSRNFWNASDEPPDQPPPQTNMQPSPRSTSSEGERKGGANPSLKKKKEDLFSLPTSKEELSKTAPSSEAKKKGEGKFLEKEGERSAFKEELSEKKASPKPFSSETPPRTGKLEPEKGPSSRYLSREEEGKKTTSPTGKKGKEKTESKPFGLLGKEEEKIKPSIPEKKRMELEKEAKARLSERREKEEGEKQREKRPIEIQGPSVPPLPPEIIPIAQAAATSAAPYLSREVLPLFYQMVGTIYVMTSPPGISRTEILLNAPSLANSRFFGTTILIEKYATAPDSLNIRLTGSNEAVTLFNQNIPSLMAAFQNGNFSFRINRIDTAYSTDRPVFRRKDSREGRDLGGGAGEKKSK